MDRQVYVGIDIHRDFGRYCAQDGRGRVLAEDRFENTREGVAEFAEQLGPGAKVAVESTGNLWKGLWRALEARGIEAHLVHVKKTKPIAQNRLKSDKLDARMLATMLRGDFLICSYVPPMDIRAERDLVRLRTSFVQQRTGIRNRVHSLLHKHLIRPEFSDLFEREGRKFLADLQLPSEDRIALASYLKVLDVLDEEIQAIEAHIASEADEEIQLLMSIPGIDYFSATLIHSEIGDISRFPSHNKLAAWIGIIPSMHQSGDVCYRGRITKQGSARMRWVLLQCAHSAVVASPKLRAFHERIARRKGQAKAYVAVARKLMKVIHAVLTRREPSEYGDPNKHAAKLRRMERKAKPYPLEVE